MSDTAAEHEQARKREMRRARNRRYQERKKERQEVEEKYHSLEQAVFMSDGGLYGFFVPSKPLRIPINPSDTVRIHQVASLNRRLQDWGYRDDPRSYIKSLDQEHLACENDASLEIWPSKMEEWIIEGDSILDAIQTFMCDGYLDLHTPEGLQEIWNRITTVVFKIQYMMAATEARLDMPRKVEE